MYIILTEAGVLFLVDHEVKDAAFTVRCSFLWSELSSNNGTNNTYRKVLKREDGQRVCGVREEICDNRSHWKRWLLISKGHATVPHWMNHQVFYCFVMNWYSYSMCSFSDGSAVNLSFHTKQSLTEHCCHTVTLEILQPSSWDQILTVTSYLISLHSIHSCLIPALAVLTW